MAWSIKGPAAPGAQGLIVPALLVPLPAALERIAELIRMAGSELPVFIRNERFDGLACTVCALVPVYVSDGGAIRLLSEDELTKGVFRRGGGQMYFIDGRAPLTGFAITEDGISRVVATLAGSIGPD